MANNPTSSEEKNPLRYISDIPFPLSIRFSKENVLSAIEYDAADDDVILASYPRTGSYWMLYILIQIMKGPECFPEIYDFSTDVTPYLERVGASKVRSMQPPRLIKTHFTYELVPKGDKTKYIYMFRDPRDVCLSYCHFLSSRYYGNITLKEAFERFISGRIQYGNYFDHLRSWFAHKDNHQILFICYEDLKADCRQQILKVAEFLGEKYSMSLKNEEGLVEKILSNTTFDNMKQRLKFNFRTEDLAHFESVPSPSEKVLKYFSKGTVGEWKKHLSEEQIRILVEQARAKLLNEELLKMWNI